MNMLTIFYTFYYTLFSLFTTTMPPVDAVDDTVTVDSGDTLTISVLANDLNLPGDTVFLQIIDSSAHGTLSIDSLNQVIYIHDGTASYTDSFTYLICTLDSITSCDAAFVSIQINPNGMDTISEIILLDSTISLCPYVNSSLILEDFIDYTTDSNLTFNILAQGDNSIANIYMLSAYEHLLTIDPSPIQDLDTLSILVCNTSACDTLELYLDIHYGIVDTHYVSVMEGLNSVALAYSNDSYSSVTIIDENINANTAIAYNVSTDKYVLNYTPHAGMTSDTVVLVPISGSFSLGVINTCNDGNVYIFNTMSDTTSLLQVNNDTVSINLDSIPLIDVTANDSLPSGTLYLSIIDSSLHGNAFITSQNNVVYQPNLGFEGLDSFQYLICMDSMTGFCDSAWVLIQVGTVDTTTQTDTVQIDCINDTIIIASDSVVNINIMENDIFLYATDVNVSIINPSSHGNTLLTSLQNIIYIPDSSFVGVDSFQYTVCYDSVATICDTAWVYIFIGENIPPISPENLVLTSCPLSTVTIDLDDYFTDADDSSLTYTFTNNSSLLNWSFIDSINLLTIENNAFTFNPSTIEIVGCDSYNQCDTMLLHFVPTTTIDTVQVNIYTEDTFTIHSSFPQQQIIDSFHLGTTLQDSLSADLFYIADSMAGMDTLILYQFDTLSNTCLLTVYEVTIQELNPSDTLSLQDDNIALNQDETVYISPLINDVYTSWDTLYIIDGASQGDATVSDSLISYTPAAGYAGWDSLQYVVCNGTICDTAWIYLQIISTQAPVAVTDQVSTLSNTEIIIDALANDQSTNAVHISSYTQGEHGTVTMNSDGTLTYTPDPGYIGLDVFGYTMCDDINLLCDTTLVLINVEEVTPEIVVVSNVITPNGDGYNDNLMISNLHYYTSNQLNIYNRWGVLVYQKDNYQSDWNSTWESKQLPNGTYYYVLYLDRNKISEANTKSGFIFIAK